MNLKINNFDTFKRRKSTKRACSVKVWCIKITRILSIVVQTGANVAVL